MKPLLRRVLAFVLTLSLLPLSAFALDWRDPVEFTDVPDSHWARYDIDMTYRRGLMNGTGGGLFSPGDTLTVAQAIAVAVRTRTYYTEHTLLTLDQSGEHWYDSAVEAAIQAKIITANQFDSYDQPATRAELAGILGRALPADGYKAINNITSLPDVDASTPYSAEIFKLYNAGVFTGSDGYGTFHPDRDITRAELAALLYRLSGDYRKEFILSPVPADLTVYSTNKRLLVDGFPVYGLTRINGEYYIPAALLDNDSTSAAYLIDCYWSYYDKSCSVSFDDAYGEIPLLDYWARPPEGKVMGTADANPWALEFNYETYQGGVYTIGGRYPMINLNILGAVAQGDDLVLNTNTEKNYTAVPESDLAGGPIPQLKKSTDRETAIAIHDYLVNLLTYDINVSAPRGTTEAEYEAAYEAVSQAHDKYILTTNVALSSKYGICRDYADLFQNMCIRSGIPCDIVTGLTGEPHAWNTVYVDGQWLYMDCTWDDPVSRTPLLEYDYCLVGPDTMVRSHYWDGEDYPMPDEYDPAWEQLDPNNITSADMFRKCLIAQLVIANRTQGYGPKTITLRVTKSGAYGGTGCLYAGYKGANWWSYRGGYDSTKGAYVYHFE